MPPGRARHRRDTGTKYLLIYGNQEKWDSFPAGDRPRTVAEQEACNTRCRATGELAGAHGPAQTRLVRRVDGAPVVTDGPPRRPGSPGRLLPAGLREQGAGPADRGGHARCRDRPGRTAARPARVPGAGWADRTVEDLLRACTPQVLGTLVRRHGDFDACEDAVREGLLAAALQWPDQGVPDSPRGRLVGRAREERARRDREVRVAPAPEPLGRPAEADRDDSPAPPPHRGRPRPPGAAPGAAPQAPSCSSSTRRFHSRLVACHPSSFMPSRQ